MFFFYLFKLRFKDLSEILKNFALFYRLAVSKVWARNFSPNKVYFVSFQGKHFKSEAL